jgi:hypothetical protein
MKNGFRCVRWGIGALALLAALCLAGTSGAASIMLSDLSSDETPASVLDAQLDFDVTGATQMTLTVTNLSDYRITAIYFNATDVVVSLSLDSPTGWDFYTPLDPGVPDRKADGFGVFDYALHDAGSASIAPSGSATFVFTFTSLEIEGGVFETVYASDFLSERSTIPPGDTPMVVAAKFMSGPNDDSAWGAAPEPGSAALLSLGLIGLAINGRRKRS